jgi:hypothetical protein
MLILYIYLTYNRYDLLPEVELVPQGFRYSSIFLGSNRIRFNGPKVLKLAAAK